jgi:hypothetical protein
MYGGLVYEEANFVLHDVYEKRLPGVDPRYENMQCLVQFPAFCCTFSCAAIM